MTIGATSALYPNTLAYATPYNRTAAVTGGQETAPEGLKNAENQGFTPNGMQKADGHSPDSDAVKKPGRRSAPEDCDTCKNRKYQDGSDESNVSFKAAAHISPESAAARVRAHENEHVSNAYKKAAQENGEVIRASVSIHTAICPECGRTYVSGGTTNTAIRYSNEENLYVKEQKARDAVNMRGANIDYAA